MEIGGVSVQIQSCRVCHGEARASLDCHVCRGLGIEIVLADGRFVWKPLLQDTAFKVRRVRKIANAILHWLVGFVAILLFVFFIFRVWFEQRAVALWHADYWTSGEPEIVAVLLSAWFFCFLLFRVRAYSFHTASLPNWGEIKLDSEQKKIVAEMKQARDVSIYFQEAAWEVIEHAFQLAEKLHHREVAPLHLFVAAFFSAAGGIFSTRLGLGFSKIKNGLLQLLSDKETGEPTLLSREGKELLLLAFAEAKRLERRHVGVTEIFLKAFDSDTRLQHLLDISGYPATHVRHVVGWIRLQEQLKDEHDRFVSLAAFKPKTSMNRAMTALSTPILDQYSEDLTLAARNGLVGIVVERDREMQELLRAMEGGYRSVVLVGESGVGKTSLVELLARRMVEENVPATLFDRRLVSVDIPQLLAGADISTASKRLLRLLQEVGMSQNIVVVLYNVEALVGEGSGPFDLSETFASELDKRYFLAIATTTPSAWTSYLERRRLGSKLVRVDVREPESEQAIRMLMAKSGEIEYKNRVFFSYAALEKVVKLASHYVQDTRLPESALLIMQEAAVLAQREHGEHAFVTPEEIARVIHDKTGIPVESVTQDESQKLLHLEERLHGRVIGQDVAVQAVAQAMRRARAEVREGKRPIANFLFLGPTGVGKTELAKTIAAEYFGSESSMVRLDMSEYQDHTSLARVIGAPGDARGGLLTEAVRRQPFTIVLLDELEKAHPDILTLFLQVMDDGRLTDGVGRTVDFTNVVLIATSNARTDFVQEKVKAGWSVEQIKTALLEQELKGVFRPEFLNRFDGIIVFKPLTLDDVTQIAWLMFHQLAKRMEKEKGLIFRVEDLAVETVARDGYDPLYGARPLRRIIQERVENSLSDLLLQQAVSRGDTVWLRESGAMEVEKTSEL